MEETSKSSSPQKRKALNNGDIEESKKLRLENSEIQTKENKLQRSQHFPNKNNPSLIKLIEEVDLLTLCLLRKNINNEKYSQLKIEYKEFEIDSIVIRYDNECVRVKTEIVDSNDVKINYPRLFAKFKRSFSVQNYFKNFVRDYVFNLNDNFNDLKYLVIYSNADFELTEDHKLKQVPTKTIFYPFQFNRINVKTCPILRDMLFMKDHGVFYQFSQDETMCAEFCKRLELTTAMQNEIRKKNLSLEEIKRQFFKKLIFAVDQPFGKKLRNIVKLEIEENNFKDDFSKLQKKSFKKIKSDVIYEFHLIMSLIHQVYTSGKMSLSFDDNKTIDYIGISYKDKMSYIKYYNSELIGYRDLFPYKKDEKRVLSLNKLFKRFISERQKKGIKYFIFYSEADLDLNENNKFNAKSFADFYPFEFVNVDVSKKKYKILKHCKCLDDNNLYQFSREIDTREKLLSLLQFPAEKGLSDDEKQNIKEEFLNKLIFAVNQVKRKRMYNLIRKQIADSNVPYDYEELQEISLKCLAFNKTHSITLETINKYLDNVQNKRLNNTITECEDIDEIMKFVKSLFRYEGLHESYDFVNYLIRSKKYDVIKRNGLNPAHMSSILSQIGVNSVKAFDDLYNLWFDEDGNKKQCLRTIENENISLTNFSSILSRTGASGADAFKNLYCLWFDAEGAKTRYLKNLENENISLVYVSSMLNRSGGKGSKAFKELHDLWFDDKGNKTHYLTSLENEGLNMSNISPILRASGSVAPKAYKKLIDFWFDEDEKKTLYLTMLEKEGIDLKSICSLLNWSGLNAAKVFKDFYDFWFDENGNKSDYCRVLEKENVYLQNIFGILNRAGLHSAKSLKELYDLWFDKKGDKTQYLQDFEKEGISLINICDILNGSKREAVKAFKDFHNVFFDKEHNKTQYLITLKNQGINFTAMLGILNGSGKYAAISFKELYNIYFDEQNDKSEYLKTLETEGIDLDDVFNILKGSGTKSTVAFRDLFELWFDEDGNKTNYLKIEESGLTINHVSKILHGSATNAAKAFNGLYNTFFDTEGNQNENLRHFFECKKKFTWDDISCLLSDTRTNFKSTFESLHNVCFDEKGKRSQVLKDFHKAGFHTRDLCEIMSGAPGDLRKFYNFCFKNNNGKYLHDFLEDGFEASDISMILSGARNDVCDALKELHDIYFDEHGKKTKIACDFQKSGFSSHDLSRILSKTGNNASSVLKKFHKLCFKKAKYLNHFLTDEQIFTPDTLCNILFGTGTKLCFAFEDLHDLCYNETGEKTKFFAKLIMKKQTNKVLNKLTKKIKHYSAV